MLPGSCARGCARQPGSHLPSLLPQHRRTKTAQVPRSQFVNTTCSLPAAAGSNKRVLERLSSQLQRQLSAHVPPQPAATAAVPTCSRGSELLQAAGGSGSNGGNNSSNHKHVGDHGDGSDGKSSSSSDGVGSFVSRLLAGTLLLQQLAHAGPAAAAWGSKSRIEVKQDELRLLPAWEIDAFVDRMWDLSGPILNNMGFSGLLGAASAAALKWVGRTLAAAVGMSLLLVQVLSHYNVVTVNWSVVHRQAQQVLDRTGDGRLDQDSYKRVLKQGMVIMSEGVPSVSGFLVGFIVGLKVF